MSQLDLNELRFVAIAEVLPEGQLVHHLFHLLSFAGLLAGNLLFFRSGLRFLTTFTDASHIDRIQNEVVIERFQRNFMEEQPQVDLEANPATLWVGGC